MVDVLIVGAGPAERSPRSCSARAGARGAADRSGRRFRATSCAATRSTPGALARLRALGVGDAIDAHGLRVDGMLVTGEHGAAIRGPLSRAASWRARFCDAISIGCCCSRRSRRLSVRSVRRRPRAGCRCERARPGDQRRPPRRTTASTRELRARVTIAADGRRSTIAFGLGLARHPDRPRRWAIGAYFEGVGPVSDCSASATAGARARGKNICAAWSSPRLDRVFGGDARAARATYIGVAPVPGGVTNVCLVRPSHPATATCGIPRRCSPGS